MVDNIHGELLIISFGYGGTNYYYYGLSLLGLVTWLSLVCWQLELKLFLSWQLCMGGRMWGMYATTEDVL